MGRLLTHIVLILILAQIATVFAFNDTLAEDPDNKFKGIETRRLSKKKKSRSTSSDSDDPVTGTSDSEKGKESLDEEFTKSDSSSTSTDSDGVKKKHRKKKVREPVSTIEHRGWRKWHRKCTKCPEDMRKKWRDPSIKWICGAYQQARRSFKSACIMYYRNCQDGTMFTKIADHRCANGTADGIRPYKYHFFYDYEVKLTDDDTDSDTDTETETASSSSSVSESELLKRLPPFNFHS